MNRFPIFSRLKPGANMTNLVSIESTITFNEPITLSEGWGKEILEFQRVCSKTAIYPMLGNNFGYPTLGLAGETGEVCEKVKKILRDKKGIPIAQDVDDITNELGDVLWYVAMVAYEFGIPLNQCGIAVVKKLASRQERGKLGGSGDNR